MDLIEEWDGSNNLVAFYTRDGNIGGVLSRTTDSATFYYHYDGNGNVVSLTDSNENVVATYEYDAYGNLQASSGIEANNNPFRFSTKYFDSSGFYDYGFRFYDPVTGRWLNRDPIAEDGGLNLYAFVGNSPGNVWDEYGLDWREKLDNILGNPAKRAGDAWGRHDGGYATPGEVAYESAYAVGVIVSTGTGVTGIARGVGARVIGQVALRRASPSAGIALRAAGGRISQKCVDHIVLRHWYSSGIKRVSKFVKNISLRQLKNMIQTTTTKGRYRMNTNNRPGRIAEYNFGRVIGTTSSGKPAKSLRVVIDNKGNVITAFPF